MKFLELVAQSPLVLTEGALIERLRREGQVRLDPEILHAALVGEEAGRKALGVLYREYLDAGRARELPMLVGTPTWRANPERVRAAGAGEMAALNQGGAWFVREILGEYGRYAERVFVGGLMSCRGDAYRPDGGLSVEEAAAFHRPQAWALAEGGVDFLHAATLPAYPEARGMAVALAATGLPYLLSFVLRPSGCLLDGTPLDEAVAGIDAAVSPPPAYYLANCVHPEVFVAAVEAAQRRLPGLTERLIGLQANTSAKSPEELEGRATLEGMEPAAFGAALLQVWRRFRTRILGGCCGTDARHIAAVAKRVGDACSGRGRRS